VTDQRLRTSSWTNPSFAITVGDSTNGYGSANPIERLNEFSADDSAIRQAIITSVKFESACFRYFEQSKAEFWQACLSAVASARQDYPGFLDDTYRQAANDVAYYYK